MALSDGDWARLDRMRREDREHLDSVTKKLDDDSVRQWKAIAAIDKTVEVHQTKSDAVHQQPCPTAQALLKEHLDASLAHSPKKVIPLVASLLGLASTVGAWLSKLFHIKAELKP